MNFERDVRRIVLELLLELSEAHTKGRAEAEEDFYGYGEKVQYPTIEDTLLAFLKLEKNKYP